MKALALTSVLIGIAMWAAEVWFPLIYSSPSIRSVIDSDNFGAFVFLGAFVVILMPIALLTIAIFHPRRLSGRTKSGGQE